MTLVVGIRCRDGIIIGADSITTFGSAIEQESRNKLKLIEPCGLFASAGAVGLNQLIEQRLRANWDSIREMKDLADARNQISAIMWSEVEPALERVSKTRAALGRDFAEDVRCNLMVALPIQNSPRLLVFDECAQSLEVTLDSPFLSIGSGSFQADPFLAFVKRVFWDDSAPKTIAAGIFCVLWTLDHVSRVNAGLGVGGRPNVAVLEYHDQTCRAQLLSDDILMEHIQAIPAAEGRLRSFRERLDTP